jgi:chromosome segregation ATPase
MSNFEKPSLTRDVFTTTSGGTGASVRLTDDELRSLVSNPLWKELDPYKIGVDFVKPMAAELIAARREIAEKNEIIKSLGEMVNSYSTSKDEANASFNKMRAFQENQAMQLGARIAALEAERDEARKERDSLRRWKREAQRIFTGVLQCWGHQDDAHAWLCEQLSGANDDGTDWIERIRELAGKG